MAGGVWVVLYRLAGFILASDPWLDGRAVLRGAPCSVSPSQVLACVNPHALVLPKEGMLKVHFVDLRPVPDTARCE